MNEQLDVQKKRPLLAQSGLIKWIREKIGLQQEEDVWASGLHERLVSEGIFAHRAVAFGIQREPLMARHWILLI